jgi:hypothetical protein
LMAAVNHRFALSNPALVSAPSKKSFSRVSSPILARSVLTSMLGVAEDGFVSRSKISPAPARS